MQKKTVWLAVLILTSMSACAPSGEAKKEQKKNIAAAVEGKRYVFRARTAQPVRGRTIQLTSLYDLRISGDSVVAFLPYFGRAFSAPMDPREGGINFTSTDFEYQQTNSDNGGWQVGIKPGDASGVRQLFLNISANGNSSLQVTSVNRQPISFNGTVVPIN